MQRWLHTVILIGCCNWLSAVSSISIRLPTCWTFRTNSNCTKQLVLPKNNTAESLFLIESAASDQYAEQRTFDISATATNSSKTCLLVFFINSIVMAMSRKPLFAEQYMKSNEKIKEGEIFRLLTPVFMHGSIVHFFCNSLSLCVYGPPVECHFGPKGFLFIYIFSGVFSNTLTYLFKLSPYSLGSSGAIFGLVGAMVTHFRKKKVLLASRSTAEKELRNINIDLVVNLIIGNIIPNIDNWCHGFGLIGGILSSTILTLPWRRIPHWLCNRRHELLDTRNNSTSTNTAMNPYFSCNNRS